MTADPLDWRSPNAVICRCGCYFACHPPGVSKQCSPDVRDAADLTRQARKRSVEPRTPPLGKS